METHIGSTDMRDEYDFSDSMLNAYKKQQQKKDTAIYIDEKTGHVILPADFDCEEDEGLYDDLVDLHEDSL